MNRSVQMLIAVCLFIGAGIGYGIVTTPAQAARTVSSQRLAVRSATEICQHVIGNNADTSTTVSAYTPSGVEGASSTGSASFQPVGGGASVLSTPKPGVPAYTTLDSTPGQGRAIVGQADGALAPGFSLGETVSTNAGPDAGLSGMACQGPGTQFWFIGSSGSISHNSYLYLSDSDASVAEFNVTLYGKDGPIQAVGASGQPLAAGKTQAFLLSSLLGNSTTPVLAVHVAVVQGRVSAALFDADSGASENSPSNGADFVPQASGPGDHLVIPGIPTDPNKSPRQKVQLYVLAPGTTDATVNLHWVGNSTIVPAADGSITAPAGKVVTVDLTSIETAGEAAALRLDATGDVIAGIRVTRTSGDGTDFAFGGPASPITGDSIVTDNRSGSSSEWQSQLLLTAPSQAANAQITTIGTSGSPKTTQVSVPAGTTKAFPLAQPSGKAGSPYTVIVTWRGGGPLYGARVLTNTVSGPQITVQELSDAVERVTIPIVNSDLSGLVSQ
jgi:hypothetical protein